MAVQYCVDQNGYLATITSEEENEFLFSYMTQEGYKSAYFGLSDAVSERNWVWNNGEEVSYINWNRNEPNAKNANEDYAMFYYKFRMEHGMMEILTVPQYLFASGANKGRSSKIIKYAGE